MSEKSLANPLKPKRMNRKEPTKTEVMDAITGELGVTEGQLTEQRRKREAVYARFIYANERYDGSNVRQIARELGKSRNTVDYYLVRYRECYRFDPVFRDAADRVAAKIMKNNTKDEEDNSN